MEIHVQIRFAADGFPSREWMDARYAIEDRIIESGLGEIIDAGAGEGVMDVVVRVDDVQKGKTEIEAILDELTLSDVSTIRVLGEK